MNNRTGTGRGTGPDKRSVRGSVRSLFPPEAEGAGAIATEEWYETERLTGQITGRGRSLKTTASSALGHDEAPPVLDWRHADVLPAPTRLERIRGSVDRGRRRLRAGMGGNVRGSAPIRASRRPRLHRSSGEPTVPRGSEQDQHPVAKIGTGPSSSPSTASGHVPARMPERLEWRSAPGSNPRERTNRLRLRTAATLAAVALSLVATAVVAISLATRGTKPEMHDATLSARTSRPAGVLQPAVGTLIGAVEVLEHRVAHFRVVDGDVPTHRHPRHRTPPAHLSRSRAVHAPSESTSPPTEGATPPNSGSYRSSSSTPAYSSQPAAGEAATSARAPTQSAPQPAGPTGLGGVVGSNCNPKCR